MLRELTLSEEFQEIFLRGRDSFIEITKLVFDKDISINDKIEFELMFGSERIVKSLSVSVFSRPSDFNIRAIDMDVILFAQSIKARIISAKGNCLMIYAD